MQSGACHEFFRHVSRARHSAEHMSHGSEISVFVGGLSPTYDNDQLQLLFEPFGAVSSVNLLPCNSNTGNRCGFVNFSAMENAQQAVDTLHGKHSIHPGMPAIVVRFRQSKSEHQVSRMGGDYSAGAPPAAYGGGGALKFAT